MPLRILSIGIVLLALAGCETSPTGRQQLLLVSEGQIQEMGVTAYQQMRDQLPVSRDPVLNDYTQCVTRAIIKQLPASARNLQWEVTVFEDENPNAFALPGGKMGVHTGMLKLAENQDQLATVIGHEIAHVLARHHAERISHQFATQIGMQLAGVLAGPPTAGKQQLLGLLGLGAQIGILLPYSREQEREADIYGLDLMARAGFDPRASVPLWQNMAAMGGQRPPAFLATHPAPETRIRDLQERIPQVLPYYRQAITEGRLPSCSM